MPLLCHARVSRIVRTKDGASQPVSYVNHTLESLELVSWAALSAPNAAYTDVLAILNNCPEHDERILFAFLADIQPDPYYGFRVVYDGQEARKAFTSQRSSPATANPRRRRSVKTATRLSPPM